MPVSSLRRSKAAKQGSSSPSWNTSVVSRPPSVRNRWSSSCGNEWRYRLIALLLGIGRSIVVVHFRGAKATGGGPPPPEPFVQESGGIGHAHASQHRHPDLPGHHRVRGLRDARPVPVRRAGLG